MSKLKTHLLLAGINWAEENGYKIHVMVDNLALRNPYLTKFENSHNFVVINISTSATGYRVLEEDTLKFSGRFDGRSLDLVIPVDHIAFVTIFSEPEPFTLALPDTSEETPVSSEDFIGIMGQNNLCKEVLATEISKGGAVNPTPTKPKRELPKGWGVIEGGKS